MQTIEIKVTNNDAYAIAAFLRARYGKDKRTGLAALAAIAVRREVAEQARHELDEAEKALDADMAEREKVSKIVNFEDLRGHTVSGIENLDGEELIIALDNGEQYKLYHAQDCCESVTIEDVCGDLDDLLGSPLLMAEEATSESNPDGVSMDYQDSFLWTFYKLATVKGYVTIRWYGESNGYYSESVDFVKIE